MSGHSKWAQIKHKKALTDQKRGLVFSKLSKSITLAAKRGLDPKLNPSLAKAIEQAKSENMPNDNIERAIKKVSDKSSAQLEEVVIEVMGPSGLPLKIRGVTDNKNRTIAEIKSILNEFGAKMVPPGSISWMFNQPPVKISDSESEIKIEKLLEALNNQNDVDDVVVHME